LRNEPNPTLSGVERSRDAPLPAPLTVAQGLRLALASYRMLADRPRSFLRLTGPWLLLGVLGAVLDLPWTDFVSPAITWLAWAAISIAWYRLILLSAECPVGGRFGRQELRYVLVGLLMLAPALLAACVLLVVAAAAAPFYRTTLDDLLSNPWFLWPVTEVGMLGYIALVTRYQLMFPAIALIDPAMTFRSSLRLTRRSALGIFVGSVVASVPVLVPSLIWWLPDNTPQSLALAVSNGLDYLATAVAAVVVAGFCAQLYRRQVGRFASVFE
jgi:hypothetical protein